MTTQIQKFVFPLTNQETRIVDRDGNPWFIGNDVCACVSIANPRNAFARLDDDEKGVCLVEVTEYLQTKPDGSEVVRARAKITAKGLAKLAGAFEAVSSN